MLGVSIHEHLNSHVTLLSFFYHLRAIDRISRRLMVGFDDWLFCDHE